MPRPLPLPPALTPEMEHVATVLAEQDARDLYAIATTPAVWTLDVLARRTASTITRSEALALQRYVILTLPIIDRAQQWAILAATDTLGRVNTSALTRDCLTALLMHAAALHTQIFVGAVLSRATLTTRVAARKTQTLATCPGVAADFTPFLDRVETALAATLP